MALLARFARLDAPAKPAEFEDDESRVARLMFDEIGKTGEGEHPSDALEMRRDPARPSRRCGSPGIAQGNSMTAFTASISTHECASGGRRSRKVSHSNAEKIIIRV
jgi:hypothetical protein